MFIADHSHRLPDVVSGQVDLVEGRSRRGAVRGGLEGVNGRMIARAAGLRSKRGSARLATLSLTPT